MTVKEISTEEADVDWFLIPNKKTNWKGAIYNWKGVQDLPWISMIEQPTAVS